jgi:hypothetical protein
MSAINPQGGAGTQDLVTLAPGEERRFPKTGVHFRIIYAAQLVEVRLDEGPAMVMAAGMGITYSGGATFETVSIKNTSALLQSVLFYAGFAEFVQPSLPLLTPPTQNVSFPSLTSLAAGAHVAIAPTYSGRRLRRASVTITNADTSARLNWRDEAGVIGGIIFPETSVLLPISETLQVFNPNGVSVSLSVSEIYYLQ